MEQFLGITPESIPLVVESVAVAFFVCGVLCLAAHKGVFDFIHKNRSSFD